MRFLKGTIDFIKTACEFETLLFFTSRIRDWFYQNSLRIWDHLFTSWIRDRQRSKSTYSVVLWYHTLIIYYWNPDLNKKDKFSILQLISVRENGSLHKGDKDARVKLQLVSIYNFTTHFAEWLDVFSSYTLVHFFRLFLRHLGLLDANGLIPQWTFKSPT